MAEYVPRHVTYSPGWWPRTLSHVPEIITDMVDDARDDLAELKKRFDRTESETLRRDLFGMNPYYEPAEKERRFVNRCLVAMGFVVMACSVGYATDIVSEHMQDMEAAVIAHLGSDQ